jgi:hypothetical protein
MNESRIIKASLPPHSGKVRNDVEFERAFNIASEHPNQTYNTTGNETPFTMMASYAKRGKHINEPVLRFITDGKEKARSYKCCWGHKTNCNRTHIDCYTRAIRPQPVI